VFAVAYKPRKTVGSRQSAVGSAQDRMRVPACEGWPFDAAEAKRRQAALGPATRTVDLGGGIKLELVHIPGGEFVMGAADGAGDERPMARAKVESFWMGKLEVTNEQFARFDPAHDSRLESGDFLQFSVRERGYPMNAPRQPVARVSWHQAAAFCRWLSEQTGEDFALPTEAQWEWACRAGTATPLWYGGPKADFTKVANLADHSLRFVDTFGWGLPSGAVPPWRPAIETVNDGHRVTAPVGSYQPNHWGLCDMHGNAAEWTRSHCRSYPYRNGDGRGEAEGAGRTAPGSGLQVPGSGLQVPGSGLQVPGSGLQVPGSGLQVPGSPITHHASRITHRVVRGGSFYDRPMRARSAWRLAYPAWQRVFDVGFRVVALPRPTVTQR